MQLRKGAIPEGKRTISHSCSRRYVLRFQGFKVEMGVSAHFLFVSPVADRERWFLGTLEGLGYELVDLESSRSGLLRVFIDSPKGITVDDCARVSRHLSNALAVHGIEEQPLHGSSAVHDHARQRDVH